MFALSCGDMDDTYDEFLNDGETIYTGRPDALQAFSGNKRVKLTWLLISDPKIVKAKVFWKNPELQGTEPLPGQRKPGRDSVEIAIQRTSGIDPVELIIGNMREGVYTFEVFTYDKNGNSSIRSEVIAEVFGDTYQSSVSNRPLNKAVYYNHFTNPTSSLDLEWFGVAQQVVSMDIWYTDTDDVERKIQVTKVVTTPGRPGVFADRTILSNFQTGTELRYRTAYLPNATAIDTFYTDYKTISAVENSLMVRPGLYKIVAKHSGKALKVRSNSTSANAQVEQNTFDDLLTSFKWRLSYNPEGYVVLTSLNSQMDMAVASSGTPAAPSTSDGANIIQIAQVSPSGTSCGCHDEWILEATDATNQYFSIKNRFSTKVMEVAAAGTNDGASIQQRGYGGTDNQSFEFVLLQ
jgi:hypothetical protein